MMTGNPDLCSEIQNHKEAKAPLEMVGFPTECPVDKVCGTKLKLFRKLVLFNSIPIDRVVDVLMVLRNSMQLNLRNI